MRGGKYLSFDMFWPTKSTNIRLSPTQLLCQLCRLCLKWCNPEFFTHPHFPANLLMALASMILCSGLVMPQLAQRLGSMVSTTLPSFSNLSMMTVLFSCSRSQSNWSFNLRLMKDAKSPPEKQVSNCRDPGKTSENTSHKNHWKSIYPLGAQRIKVHKHDTRFGTSGKLFDSATGQPQKSD